MKVSKIGPFNFLKRWNDSTLKQFNRGRGKVADAVRTRLYTVLSKTPGYEELKNTVFMMSGDSTVKLNFNFSPADIVTLKHASFTFSDVEAVSVKINLFSETEEGSFSSTRKKGSYPFVIATYNKNCVLIEVRITLKGTSILLFV